MPILATTPVRIREAESAVPTNEILCQNCLYRATQQRPIPKDCPFCAEYRERNRATTQLVPFRQYRLNQRHVQNSPSVIQPSPAGVVPIAEQVPSNPTANSACNSHTNREPSNNTPAEIITGPIRSLSGSLLIATYQRFRYDLCEHCKRGQENGLASLLFCRNCEIVRVLKTYGYARKLNRAFQWQFDGTTHRCLTTPPLTDGEVESNTDHAETLKELMCNSQPDLSTACSCLPTSNHGLGWAVVGPSDHPRKAMDRRCTGACDNSRSVLRQLLVVPRPWLVAQTRVASVPMPEANDEQEKRVRKQTW